MKTLNLFGILFLLGNTIVLYVTFLAAILNDFKITINVNGSGEGILEFFYLPFTLILGIFVLRSEIKYKDIK